MEINHKYSLEGLMLKLQYFGHLRKTHSLEKTLMLGKTGGRRRKGLQRMRWLDGIIDSMGHESEPTLGDGDGQGSLACCSPWGHKELDTMERLNNQKGVKKEWDEGTVRPEEKTMRSRWPGESAKCHSRKAGTRDIRHMAPELLIFKEDKNSERSHEIICLFNVGSLY